MIKKFFLVFITLIWMSLIFYLSHQTGNSSSGFSDKIVDFMIDIFIKNFDNMSSLEKIEIHDNFSFIIRKSAHYTEYFILGILLILTVKSFFKKEVLIYIISSSFGIVYAISDEFHQSFIDSRTPAIKDVFIDSMGLLTAIFLIGTICNILVKDRKK